MKQVSNLFIALFVFAFSSFSQSGNTIIPELVFQNPVLTSGIAGQDGAIYKFSNVATGVDATVQIKTRSSVSVILSNIDVPDMGWAKAFQPQLGIQGNVPANQNWWMDFEMRFYKAGTNEKQKIKGFKVTAIDVDGDGLSIQEYLQMNKVKSVAYCPVNYLIETITTTTSSSNQADDGDNNNKGTDRKVTGPVMNYTNIDTLGTPVMSTYTYEDKDMISFRYGAKSGASISNAGERLNSLWFKSFELTPPRLLPLVNNSYIITYDKKNVNMQWKSETVDQIGDFTIERGTDNINFKAIGQVKASETTSFYTYTDANVFSSTGIVYYRILYREKTGEAKYSTIKVVRLSKDVSSTLSIYPNPVQNGANVTLPNSWQNKAVVMTIFNVAGMQVQTVSIKAASQTEALDFQHMTKGMYVVKAQCDGQWQEQRVIKN